jgi:hypothetical protein
MNTDRIKMHIFNTQQKLIKIYKDKYDTEGSLQHWQDMLKEAEIKERYAIAEDNGWKRVELYSCFYKLEDCKGEEQLLYNPEWVAGEFKSDEENIYGQVSMSAFNDNELKEFLTEMSELFGKPITEAHLE